MAILNGEIGAVLSKSALVRLFDHAATLTAEQRRELADAVCWGREIHLENTEASAASESSDGNPVRRGRRPGSGRFESVDDFAMQRENAIFYLRAINNRQPEKNQIAHWLGLSERAYRNWEKLRLG